MGVVAMPESLLSTVALLEAAANPRVRSRRIYWQAMERVLRLLRTAFKESESNPLSAREVEVAALTWSWARTCMDGPVSPSHVSTGIERLKKELDVAIEILAVPRLSSLAEAVERVRMSEHPGASAVVELISDIGTELPRDSDQSPSIVLILRGEGLPAVREWVEKENLDVQVVTATQARQSALWNHVILFGPPDRYMSSTWLTGSQASAKGGWLISAPPAPVITVMLWTGHGRLSQDGYQPWRGAPKSPVETSDTIDISDDDFIPESLDSFRPVKTPSFGQDEGETEEAYGLQFSINGETILGYFHPDVGPKPSRVTFDDGHVLVARVPLKTVRRGHCLLFRTSIAGGDALDIATTEWFATNRQDMSLEHAEKLQRDLKARMRARLTEVGKRQVVEDLQAQGLGRGYAQMLPARLVHPDFIAPQSRQDYMKVCNALKLDPGPKAFSYLQSLRTGRRQAGLVLSNRISQRLDEMSDLVDQLRETGGFVLAGSGVEGVALLIVREIDADTVPVPAWRLGAILTKDGHSWHL